MNEQESTTGGHITAGVEQTPNSESIREGWIREMVERESIPRPERTETIESFCKRHGISEGTYDYHRRKPETKKKVIKIWLDEAFNGGNTVLRKLKEKADSGDIKAIELYMKFVLELAENLDVKSDGRTIIIQVAEQILQRNDFTFDPSANSK